jgi:single-strand DNA-binding protein
MNKVILIGRLTSDPELRQTQAGTSSATFTVAVDRIMGKDKEKEADFIRCVAWGKTADHISKFFNKGKQIALEGNIKTGSYEKDGVKHFTTDVWVDKVEFVGSKSDGNGAQAAPQQTATTVEEVTTDDLPF